MYLESNWLNDLQWYIRFCFIHNLLSFSNQQWTYQILRKENSNKHISLFHSIDLTNKIIARPVIKCGRSIIDYVLHWKVTRRCPPLEVFESRKRVCLITIVCAKVWENINRSIYGWHYESLTMLNYSVNFIFTLFLGFIWKSRQSYICIFFSILTK